MSVSQMMRQYLSIKEENKDSILFFRLGDFYEMFFEDALIASRELEITLTGKSCGMDEKAPMCGVPFHSADSYIARLIGKGYKVAVCEQVEDAKSYKDIVKREVVRVITPGTLLDPNVLDAGKNNYICTIYKDDNGAGLAFADVTTGEMSCTSFSGEGFIFHVCNELARYNPSEIILNQSAFSDKHFAGYIKDRFTAPPAACENELYELSYAKEKIYEAQGLSSIDDADDYCYRAVGALFEILSQTQKIPLSHISGITAYSEGQFMELDMNTRRNLEITVSLRDKAKSGTLLWVLDHTNSSMGARMLRRWLEQPLVSCVPIRKRLNGVEDFVRDDMLRDETASLIKNMLDVERILSRIVYKTANARDLVALKTSVSVLPALREKLKSCKSMIITELLAEIDPLTDIHNLIDFAIKNDPPFSIREGDIIKPGYNEMVDKYRNALKNGKKWLAELESREKEKTGIKTLKVGFNKVFGYYIEVSNSFKNDVPPDYVRKQTLTGGERFINEELKRLEETIVNADENRVALEFQLFEKIRDEVAKNLIRIQQTFRAAATVDCLCALAIAAVKNNYCKPEVNQGDKIIIKDGRHPVVEKSCRDSMFVPNDTELDCNDNRLAIITGPNMAGKSTYMRQTALITLMAQIGSFVPASYAEIGVVDKVFTRVGASDDIASGQSTFMVEMSEVAYITKNATSKSLIILDEIGRGTSTFDGLAIAWAVAEHAADKKKLGAKTLFATHYHELTELEPLLPGVKNYSIAVKRRGEDVIFLRKIVKGGADGSFGIEVARLAGVPKTVIGRAREILKELEAGGTVEVKVKGQKTVLSDEPLQTGLFDSGTNEVLDEIKILDLSTYTPIEALNKLYEIQKKIKK